jgi:hypothetical protein
MLTLPVPSAQHVSDQEGGVAISGGVRVIDVVDSAAGLRGADVHGESVVGIDYQIATEFQSVLGLGRPAGDCFRAD